MTYQIELTPPARRDLHRLSTRMAFAVVEYIEGPLTENPYRVGKPLANELKGRYSARVGFYRIIYEIDDVVRVINVVRIAHRADVYRT